MMNEMTKEEIRDFFIWYFNTDPKSREAKDERLFDRLIRSDTDVTEDIVINDIIPESAGSLNTKYHDLLNELYMSGRCKDKALDWAKVYVTDKMEFVKSELQPEKCSYTWDKKDEEALISWLLCKSDSVPSVIPKRFDINWFNVGWLENTFGCISYVCDFPLRYCAYTVYSGTVFQFKFPFRGLLAKKGSDECDILVNDIKKILSEDFKLDISEVNTLLMRTFSACCFVSPKQKAETEFYMRYIDDWIKQDREGFINAINAIESNDTKKKILKSI